MFKDIFPAFVSLAVIAATFTWARVSDRNNLRNARPVLEPAPESEELPEYYQAETPDAA